MRFSVVPTVSMCKVGSRLPFVMSSPCVVTRQECDCDHPLYKNTWTLDETSQYTTIMSGKPKMAGDKTWCLDAGSKGESALVGWLNMRLILHLLVPADTTKPHVRTSYQPTYLS
jgi:hypothetical protein